MARAGAVGMSPVATEATARAMSVVFRVMVASGLPLTEETQCALPLLAEWRRGYGSERRGAIP